MSPESSVTGLSHASGYDKTDIWLEVDTEKLVFDGNIGQETFSSWDITFDLEKENVWIKTR